ncbi:Pmd1p [Saccharomyces paradoxus]|uniref:Pmd1p n=1 Tax=Saccharomyces paradoxus TaxID=27291 RepID=A0A8B8UQC5_SACPA|nr:Pmd1 [Saccharomyces paradoxus]QHS72921.1 Pmd1 [Saccharomyces paradoxus]
MNVLQPPSSVCYPLNLPIVPNPNLDEATRKKLTLECRTGAAVELARSGVFVHGGLTLPLNLSIINSLQLQKELILYFGKQKHRNADFKTLADWISPEIFFLDLISRTWQRINTTIGAAPENEMNTDLHFKERLLHSMCFTESNIYIFGGLIVSPHNGYELIATNELWKLDLKTKCWSLVSENPQITRRFNHNMHVLNENNEKQDTKLIIVGGLDNMDIPVKKIDIFNLRTNLWESESKSDEKPDSKRSPKILVNIDGMPISLSHDSNFSVLIENNQAEIPTLALYYPQREANTSRRGTDDSSFSSYANDLDEKSRLTKHHHHHHGDLKYIESDDADESAVKTLMSPIVILPLLGNSQGARMTSNPTQNNKENSVLQVPFHLQYPSGNYFNYNIVVIGFYPDPQPSNLHCFIYNIASGKWIRVNIACTECSMNTHRFWKLLIWKSHHQALLLGTRSDDFCSPSVQKFDHILAFSLPMLNGYNKLVNTKHSRACNGIANNHASKVNLSLYDHLPYSDSSAIEHTNSCTGAQGYSLDDSELPGLTSTTTSQFENYSRYITVPLEMESTSSIFPPYAMVLGKDALEIFGKTLSDFEFITAEGDSIGVPVYLLRKRWGRYFDSLLSNGYANTSFNYEFNGDPSNIISFSPHTASKATKFGNSSQSSSGSLEKYFSKNANSKSNSNTSLKKPHSVDFASSASSPKQRALSHSKISPSEPILYTDDEESRSNTLKQHATVEVGPQEATTSNRRPISTTCSSTGMVFRVPFQDVKNSKLGLSEQSGRPTRASSVSPPPVYGKSINNDNDSNCTLSNTPPVCRRASTVGTTRNNSVDDSFSSIRRASHPLQSHIIAKSSPNSISKASPAEQALLRRKSSALRFIASPHQSRQTSFASTASTASVVSSTSGRRRPSNQVSHFGSSASLPSSPILPVLNIPLPPQEKIPLEPLPPVPKAPSRRSSSLAEYVQFSRDSPIASRRSSHSTRKSSSSDARRVSNSSLLRNTLDSQLLSNTCGNDIPYEASVQEYGMNNGRDEEENGDNEDYSCVSPSNIRPIFSTINAININGNFKEGEFFSSKSYINSEKGRRLSYISNPESVESTNSNNNAIIELEPLLTPRSLYMPWSTASVRAFAEFFYTAQINGKWLLAPVTLDLLIMAKIYEIPILYELITEVLYKIISKKEEGLSVTCEALLNLYQQKVSRYCNENEGKIRKELDSSESYQDTLEIKRSLANIDNGYVDSYLLRNTSMAQSIHYTDDSNGDTETDTHHTRVSSIGSLANRAVPTVFAGGPRDSHNSVGSIAFPSNSGVQNTRRSVSLLSPAAKKKSSLSRETDPLDTSDRIIDDVPDSGTVKRQPNFSRRNSSLIQKIPIEPTKNNCQENVFSSSNKASDDKEEQNEQTAFQDMSNLEKSKAEMPQRRNSDDAKNLDGNTDPLKNRETNICSNSSNLETDLFICDSFGSDSSSSLHSDSDDLDSQLGILPFTKMNKKLQEQTSQEFDDSIDPLYKIGSNTPGSSRLHGSFSKYIRPNSQREDVSEYVNISSLENMVSPNALPPVDYVMKSIYRTSVLVNDSNLMTRTKEAIELSKVLKRLKKKALQDISQMDNEMREAGKPIFARGSSSPTLSRQHSDIISPLKQQDNTRPALKLASSSPISEGFRKSSIKFTQTPSAQISPRTSVTDFTASQQRRQHMNKRFSTQTAHSTSALFMNPAFMPPAVNTGRMESEGHNEDGPAAANKANKKEEVTPNDNDNIVSFPFFSKRR